MGKNTLTTKRGLTYLEEFVEKKDTISHDDTKIISINMEQNSLYLSNTSNNIYVHAVNYLLLLHILDTGTLKVDFVCVVHYVIVSCLGIFAYKYLANYFL